MLILSSVGANTVRAMRSHSRQNPAPPRKHAGIIRIGFAVPNRLFARCGTAMPTNEIGPANAATHAESTLDSRISTTRNAAILTPILRAYPSPSWYALIGLDSRNTHTSDTSTTGVITRILSQEMPEKLPIDQLCRLTILESSAKVMTKSVTAEQI